MYAFMSYIRTLVEELVNLVGDTDKVVIVDGDAEEDGIRCWLLCSLLSSFHSPTTAADSSASGLFFLRGGDDSLSATSLTRYASSPTLLPSTRQPLSHSADTTKTMSGTLSTFSSWGSRQLRPHKLPPTTTWVTPCSVTVEASSPPLLTSCLVRMR